jgi:putative hydrolase of the HAD superfamily
VSVTDRRPSPGEIDAILFDAGGVLLLPDAEIGRAAMRPLGCESTAEDWRRAHYSANLVIDTMDRPDWSRIRRTIAAEIGVSDDRLEEAVPLIEELIIATPWVAIDGAAETLAALSDAGYLLAVVSNAFGTVEQELEALGVCSVAGDAIPRVETVIDSHLVGVEKPDPRIFHVALERLGVDATRSIYVGDTVKYDVLGATAAKLHPIHLDPYEFCAGDHAHVAHLRELRQWLVPD